ncbi:N-acetyltransferase family protein [uncultured Brevundimonas sp.]|uniref:GNAT family N-acetyltransferase n=1 Tax=uncultured Brevundimonas sp. TaxID=213418 RepID=UPI0030EE8D35
MITIRDAVESDLPLVTALYGREVELGTATFETDPPSLEEITRRFRAVRGFDLPWLIATVDGAFAGYAYATPFRPRPAYRYAVEESVYVEESARGRGVGRTLLAAIIDRSHQPGLRHLIAAISEGATGAASIGLHSALGFRKVGTYRQVGWKHGRWLDVTLMQLDLAPDSAPPAGSGWLVN